MGRKGKIHYADMERSARLQRVARLLMDGEEHGTLEIVQTAKVCAVNSAVAELREHGITVRCRKIEQGRHVYRIEDTFMRMCCACPTILGGKHVEGAHPRKDQTHGYCRKCEAKLRAELGERSAA